MSFGYHLNLNIFQVCKSQLISKGRQQPRQVPRYIICWDEHPNENFASLRWEKRNLETHEVKQEVRKKRWLTEGSKFTVHHDALVHNVALWRRANVERKSLFLPEVTAVSFNTYKSHLPSQHAPVSGGFWPRSQVHTHSSILLVLGQQIVPFDQLALIFEAASKEASSEMLLFTKLGYHILACQGCTTHREFGQKIKKKEEVKRSCLLHYVRTMLHGPCTTCTVH